MEKLIKQYLVLYIEIAKKEFPSLFNNSNSFKQELKVLEGLPSKWWLYHANDVYVSDVFVINTNAGVYTIIPESLLNVYRNLTKNTVYVNYNKRSKAIQKKILFFKEEIKSIPYTSLLKKAEKDYKKFVERKNMGIAGSACFGYEGLSDYSILKEFRNLIIN